MVNVIFLRTPNDELIVKSNEAVATYITIKYSSLNQGSCGITDTILINNQTLTLNVLFKVNFVAIGIYDITVTKAGSVDTLTTTYSYRGNTRKTFAKNLRNLICENECGPCNKVKNPCKKECDKCKELKCEPDGYQIVFNNFLELLNNYDVNYKTAFKISCGNSLLDFISNATFANTYTFDKLVCEECFENEYLGKHGFKSDYFKKMLILYYLGFYFTDKYYFSVGAHGETIANVNAEIDLLYDINTIKKCILDYGLNFDSLLTIHTNGNTC